ncbi:MAG: ATP-binding cassette domain-containing protein [Rhodoplanes sp.]
MVAAEPEAMTPRSSRSQPVDPTPALEVCGVSYSYGAGFALEDVSLVVPPGVFTALLGPNGAGKTTLFSLITHLFESRDGAIRIGGWDVRKTSTPALRRLGVVFQQSTLDLDMTVTQNLRYFAALHGMAGRIAARRIEAALEHFDLAQWAKQKVRVLSGGYRRRVELARALLHEPSLLLLDEPTVGLDVQSRQKMVDDAHFLAREKDIGVLWATHLMDEVRGGDKVVIMQNGKIVADGTVADVNAKAACTTIEEPFARLTAPYRSERARR